MSFNGWAVALNGVMVTTCDTEFDAPDCFDLEVIDALDGPPDGVGGVPGLRTEDVTYYQRDGVKHFSDWYEPRIITITGTIIGPVEDCVTGDCSSVRQLKRDLAQAWKRGCCDTELVVYPDCYQTDLTDGLNVYPDGTFDVDTDGWTGTDATLARVTTPVFEGAGALEVTWGVADAHAQTATGPVFVGEPQTSYVVSAWLYADIGQPAPQLGATDTLGTDPIYADPIVVDGTWHYTELVWPVGLSGEIVPFVTSSDHTLGGEIVYVDTVQAMQVNPDVNRDLNGPFGIVGRPRVFVGDWDAAHRVFTYTARFDAVDQRMYVLDECGTPGYTSCEQLSPGAQLFSICFAEPVCFDGGGFCFTNPVIGPDSVGPQEIMIGGTEKVNPTITLFPPLVSPSVENLTTGEVVTLDTTLVDPNTPVTINTEDGTAFDADGNSLTHLLRGSFFMSLFPGIYTWRLIANGAELDEDPGYATVCWRDTIVDM